MFTGIVREEGVILEAKTSSNGSTLTISSQEILPGLRVGDSLSVNGCCLTVVGVDDRSFKVEATPETLRLTNLGSCAQGTQVNLEPAAKISDFLGGHLVQGHVDDKGRVLSIREEGNSHLFRFAAADGVLRYCAYKGSITVNGVSLTITAIGPGFFEVAIIPHTMEVTNFAALRPGDEVNLEADVISKYVEVHVKRLLTSAVLVLSLCVGQLAGADLRLYPNTILIYENASPSQVSQFVVRIARHGPDLVAEWESEKDQGTVHIFRQALEQSRRFTLMNLFEVGVDSESADQTTLRLSDRLFQQLSEMGDARFQLNNSPARWKLLEKSECTLRINHEEVEVPVLRLEDNRRGVWSVLGDPAVPIVVEYETPYFKQRLLTVVRPEGNSLRWIKKLPPVR